MAAARAVVWWLNLKNHTPPKISTPIDMLLCAALPRGTRMLTDTLNKKAGSNRLNWTIPNTVSAFASSPSILIPLPACLPISGRQFAKSSGRSRRNRPTIYLSNTRRVDYFWQIGLESYSWNRTTSQKPQVILQKVMHFELESTCFLMPEAIWDKSNFGTGRTICYYL